MNPDRYDTLELLVRLLGVIGLVTAVLVLVTLIVLAIVAHRVIDMRSDVRMLRVRGERPDDVPRSTSLLPRSPAEAAVAEVRAYWHGERNDEGDPISRCGRCMSPTALRSGYLSWVHTAMSGPAHDVCDRAEPPIGMGG